MNCCHFDTNRKEYINKYFQAKIVYFDKGASNSDRFIFNVYIYVEHITLSISQFLIICCL